VIVVTPARFLAALDEAVGTGEEPDGLCADRSEHRAHLHDSASLGRFWCTADQSQREPWRSERRRAARTDPSSDPPSPR
jgi:hypothetical protein